MPLLIDIFKLNKKVKNKLLATILGIKVAKRDEELENQDKRAKEAKLKNL